MFRLTFRDLNVGFENLFTIRKADLELSAAGRFYGPFLVKRYTTIRALPESQQGKPLVEQLGDADVTHDSLGGSTHTYIEAVLLNPLLSEATRAAALRIRDAFIPHKKALTDSYTDEAAAALKNRPKLAERKDDLLLFPVPEGKTLYDWVSAFLDAGDSIGKLLDQRAQAGVGPAGNVGKLRSQTIKLLYQFREALQLEIEENPALPRDLEARVFAYLDELNDRHGSTGAKKSTTEPATHETTT